MIACPDILLEPTPPHPIPVAAPDRVLARALVRPAHLQRPTPFEDHRPLDPATTIVVAYLVLTAPLLPLGGVAPIRLATLAIHLSAIAALLALARRVRPGRVARVLSDWAPLLLVPFLYLELPHLMEGMPGSVRYHDPAIAGLERTLFGTESAYRWAGAWPSPLLSELPHACYLSYYLIIYLPPLFLYLGLATDPATARSMTAYRETVLAVMLSFLSCFVVFVVAPVQGPRYLGVPEGVPSGPVRDLALVLLANGSSRGAAFPSAHVSVAVAQALTALRHQPRVGRWILPVAVGLGAGAVHGGFHYALDVLVGAAVGVVAAYVVGPLGRCINGRTAGFTSPPTAA